MTSAAQRCEACPAGTFKVDVGRLPCMACQHGKYSPEIGATSCTACPAHADSPHGGVLKTLCTCNAGFYGDGVNSCMACIANADSPSGSIYESNCTCNRGYTPGASGGACVACPAGKYKDINGSGACELCTYGKYSAATAATTESVCAACAQGYFSHEGSANSSDCFTLQTSSLDMTAPTCLANATSGHKCTHSEDCGGLLRGSCANGTCLCRSPFGGLDCNSCPPGTGGDSCQLDCTCSGHGRCSRDGVCVCSSNYTGTNCSQNICPAGQESKMEAVSMVSCIPCAAGKFKAVSGSAACALCSLGKYGKYNESGTTMCSDCTAGKYAPAQGASVPLPIDYMSRLVAA
jgi:hypothetical protein